MRNNHTITLLGVHGVGKTTFLASLLSRLDLQNGGRIRCFEYGPKKLALNILQTPNKCIQYQKYGAREYTWQDTDFGQITNRIANGEYPERNYHFDESSLHGTHITTAHKAMLPLIYGEDIPIHLNIIDAAGFVMWLIGYMDVTHQTSLNADFGEVAVEVFIRDMYSNSSEKYLKYLENSYKETVKTNIGAIKKIIKLLRDAILESSGFIILFPPDIDTSKNCISPGTQVMYYHLLKMIENMAKPVLVVIGKIDEAFRNGKLRVDGVDFSNKDKIESSLQTLINNCESVEKKIENIINNSNFLKNYTSILKGYSFVAGAIGDPANNTRVYVKGWVYSLNVETIINKAIEMVLLNEP